MAEFLNSFAAHWGWLWLILGLILAVLARVGVAIVLEVD